MLISTYCMLLEDKMQQHTVVPQEEWLAARKALLLKEKEFTHLRDKINAERVALPWVKVQKNYVFDTPKGKRNLSELFDGRSQLLTYHFMFGPGWEAGCPGCSFLCDHIDGALPLVPAHRWLKSRRTRSAWGGNSRGPLPSEAILTTITMFLSPRSKWRRARFFITLTRCRYLLESPGRNCRASAHSTKMIPAKSFTHIRVTSAAGRN